MAQPHSNDLRQKLLEAYDQSQGNLSELTRRFDAFSCSTAINFFTRLRIDSVR
jgi:hypothetical protein